MEFGSDAPTEFRVVYTLDSVIQYYLKNQELVQENSKQFVDGISESIATQQTNGANAISQDNFETLREGLMGSQTGITSMLKAADQESKFFVMPEDPFGLTQARYPTAGAPSEGPVTEEAEDRLNQAVQNAMNPQSNNDAPSDGNDGAQRPLLHRVIRNDDETSDDGEHVDNDPQPKDNLPECPKLPKTGPKKKDKPSKSYLSRWWHPKFYCASAVVAIVAYFFRDTILPVRCDDVDIDEDEMETQQ